MDTIEDVLEKQIAGALASLGFSEVRADIRPAARPEFGDYSTAVCLGLAKASKQNPLALAERLRETMVAASPQGVQQVTVSPPGFVNFTLDAPDLAKHLLPLILREGVRYGSPAMRPEGKVLIEHTNINSNKAAHIGHLRNACIGDTLARLLRAAGYVVEVENYIDDTGVQVADVVVGFQVLQPVYDASVPFDYFCSDIYTRISRRMEAEPDLQARRKQVLRDIEEGHNETAQFAKELSLKIVRAHLATMARLGITYDLLTWESDILALGFWQHAFLQLKERNILVHPSDGPLAGCWVVPFDDEEQDATETARVTAPPSGNASRRTKGQEVPPPEGEVAAKGSGRTADKVLVKADGVATYTAKDIAYQLWKFGLLGRDFGYELWGEEPDGHRLWTTTTGQTALPDAPHFGGAREVINVIDVRQSYLQHIVKESLRRLGFTEQSDRSIHLGYEVVTLSADSARALGVGMVEGRTVYALSGRQGIEIKADDLITLVQNRVAERTRDTETAKAVAAGAVRYYMLKFSLNQIIVFDTEEALKTTGDSGVYLQYAYARANSILRRVGYQGAPSTETPAELHPSERALLLKLSEYPRLLRAAAERRSPATMTQIAFQLATQFTDFIEHTPPIVREENADLRAFRTGLVAATRQVLGNALSVLGIPALESI